MDKKILIADDDPNVLDLVKKRLAREGYLITAVSCGKDAVAMAKKKIPDIMLLDVLMPDLSGLQVAEELKKDPATKDIPVIFMTALITKTDENLDIKGSSIFISKPFDMEIMLKEIQKLLQ